jgi:hypothetical protein
MRLYCGVPSTKVAAVSISVHSASLRVVIGFLALYYVGKPAYSIAEALSKTTAARTSNLFQRAIDKTSLKHTRHSAHFALFHNPLVVLSFPYAGYTAYSLILLRRKHLMHHSDLGGYGHEMYAMRRPNVERLL